jgi:UDPglucose 6-dehydrogenase
MKIVVVGSGYVGLVTGTCLADIGHYVTCVDLNEAKIKMLKEGISPIYEPGLDDLMRRNMRHDRLHFTTDLVAPLKGASAAFIAVGTPEGEDGSADLVYVKAVAQTIAANADHEFTVIVKSTVPVGTCDIVQNILDAELKKRGCTFKLHVASNPEFLKEGTAIEDFRRPDRIVCGANSSFAENSLREIYATFIVDDPGKLLMMDRHSSELTKYGANAMLATRISFMNELSQLCEIVGANIDHVRRGMGSDGRIGKKFLYAGPGYGGSCFPKDVMALQKSGEQHGIKLGVLNAVTTANENHKLHLAKKVVKQLGGNLKGKVVAVWGLAFKPGTDDVRETPSHTFIEEVVKAGATVVAHDPKGNETYLRDFGTHPSVTLVDEAYKALQGADALVLVTEWSEYKRPNWDKVKTLMRSHNVFDFRNQYVANDVIQAGFHYRCVGRPDSCVKV